MKTGLLGLAVLTYALSAHAQPYQMGAGTDSVLMDIASRGYDTTEWMAKQDWCVGTAGDALSHLSVAQQ